MRSKFSSMLAAAAHKDKRILLLTGDHGYALFDEFREECADQYINCGIAEQNMVGVAAGLAKTGFLPIVYGLAAFIPMRVLEQIKMDVCYENLPVIFIGDGAGVVYSHLGTSHQCTEDIAALRAIPNIEIYSPCDVEELDYTFSKMLKFEKPSYLRFGKADLGAVHEKPIRNVSMGDLLCVHNAIGSNRAFIATGSMVASAVRIAKEEGGLSVWSVPAISSLNISQITALSEKYNTVYVVEEHSVHGGLASLVAETLSSRKSEKTCRVVPIGIRNKFSEFCGTYAYLIQEHGLADADLRNVIRAG